VLRACAIVYNTMYGNVQRPVHVRAFRGYRKAVARAQLPLAVAGPLGWTGATLYRERVIYASSAPTRMLRADRPAAAAAADQ